MRNWSERDAQALRDLEAKRNRAQSALDEDIAKLTKNCAERDVISAFLREHGQRTLDALIEHFAPSGKPYVVEIQAVAPVPQAVTTHDLSAGKPREAGAFREGIPVVNVTNDG